MPLFDNLSTVFSLNASGGVPVVSPSDSRDPSIQSRSSTPLQSRGSCGKNY